MEGFRSRRLTTVARPGKKGGIGTHNIWKWYTSSAASRAWCKRVATAESIDINRSNCNLNLERFRPPFHQISGTPLDTEGYQYHEDFNSREYVSPGALFCIGHCLCTYESHFYLKSAISTNSTFAFSYWSTLYYSRFWTLYDHFLIRCVTRGLSRLEIPFAPSFHFTQAPDFVPKSASFLILEAS